MFGSFSKRQTATPRNQNMRKSMKIAGFGEDRGTAGGSHGTQSRPAHPLTSSSKHTATTAEGFEQSGSILQLGCQRVGDPTSRILPDSKSTGCPMVVLLSERVKRLAGLLHSTRDHREHSHPGSAQLFRRDFDTFSPEGADCNLGSDPKHFVEGCAASQPTPRLVTT